MKARLDTDKIAKRLGGERRGRVEVKGGYFGAMQVVADVETLLRVPAHGGRPTNPGWTERRLVPLAPETLERLEELAKAIRTERGISIEPMQLAAVILERTATRMTVGQAEDFVVHPRSRAAVRRRRGGG